MKDFDNQPIEIGSTVILMTSPREFGSVFLMKGIVVSNTEKSIRIELPCGKKVTRKPKRVGVLNKTIKSA